MQKLQMKVVWYFFLLYLGHNNKNMGFTMCTFLRLSICILGLLLGPLLFGEAPNQSTSPSIIESTPHFTPPQENEPVFPLDISEPAKQNDKFFAEFLNMLATLGFIIALIFIIAWFFKRMMNTRMEQINSTSLIQVVEKRALSPKTALYLLEVENKTILIAETPSGVTPLSEFPTAVEKKEVPASKEFPSPFSKLLEKKKEEGRP